MTRLSEETRSTRDYERGSYAALCGILIAIASPSARYLSNGYNPDLLSGIFLCIATGLMIYGAYHVGYIFKPSGGLRKEALPSALVSITLVAAVITLAVVFMKMFGILPP